MPTDYLIFLEVMHICMGYIPDLVSVHWHGYEVDREKIFYSFLKNVFEA